MIRYTLKCSQGHSFESWFKSASAFDSLRDGGHLACSTCGDSAVTKALMAPAVATTPATPTPQEQALAALRRKVEAESDYVGLAFAAEARAIHDGEAPERAIWGEARLDEAKRLLEDGIPVVPLPFVPTRKAN